MEIRQGDYGYDIIFTVKNPDGTVVDLSTATEIKIFVATVDTYRNILNGDCVVTDGVNGKCKYSVVTGDFEDIGNYYGALRITFPASRRTTKNLAITVGRELE
ncbi:hypothetical protein ACFL2J_05510 [Candidatus Omnitrophota bacterium]